mgnify:CR=1 FL=1
MGKAEANGNHATAGLDVQPKSDSGQAFLHPSINEFRQPADRRTERQNLEHTYNFSNLVWRNLNPNVENDSGTFCIQFEKVCLSTHVFRDNRCVSYSLRCISRHSKFTIRNFVCIAIISNRFQIQQIELKIMRRHVPTKKLVHYILFTYHQCSHATSTWFWFSQRHSVPYK